MKIKTYILLMMLFLVSGTVMVSLAKPSNAPIDPPANTGDRTSLSSTSDGTVIVPVPDGMYILLLLASGYGVSKYFQARKQLKVI